MIYVTASVQVKEGKLQGFIELFNATAALVRKEKGCVQYVAGVDADVGLPVQTLQKNGVTVLEKWESPEALRDHLASPHMQAFFGKEKDFVEGASVIRVFKEA